ncbi:HPP family protein [Marinobacter sp. M4C]|uniref:HPP family protein n=2 Tax=unclassified Marinobacter TaxID=83889 RepID=UPI00200D129B|nr:HPP family protein [Marinobacter sp. M4C]MCL1485976.1 HPP family protein [Marinobacter sp.]UQG55901.1 HPP family protein [Marinobacter sp. M4C]UQG55932.1 HPP family protein [Marinobacter sp. M4C]
MQTDLSTLEILLMYKRLTTSRYLVPLLAGLGAMLCITALSSLGSANQSSVWLMAPFGATMVILFGLPESPLAQPRNIIIGHLLTTATGLSVAALAGVTHWSMGLAVGLAVSLMMLTNTTHPPAGANPLVVMLAGEHWGFLLTPVAAGTVLIVAFGVVYHRLISGQRYPKQWL